MSSNNGNPHLSESGPPARVPAVLSQGFPAYAEPKGNTLSLLGVAEACFRHRTRLIVVASLTMLITLAAAFLMPKKYQADMQLLVLNARENSVISSDADVPSRASEITESDVNSEAELLRSRDVLSGALDKMSGAALPGIARDKAIDKLNQSLDASPVRESDILNVSYVDSSPEAATRVLQALASSFVEKELSLRRPAHSRELFQQLVDKNRRDLTMAEAKLASFKIITGFASLNDDELALLRQIEGTSTQSAELAAEISEARQRAARTRAELESHPDRIVTQVRSTPNQRAVEDLTTKLVDLENQRTALLARYQPTEPNVLELQDQIDTIQGEIHHQQSESALESTTDVNTITQELKGELAKAQIASSALTAREHTLEVQKSGYSQKLNSLEEQTSEYHALQQQVTESQKNYDLAVQKRDQAAFDDALDSQRILNVAFAAKPSASSIPIAPKPGSYLVLGFFTAIFLGIGSCIFSEMTRSVVYSPSELDSLTGLMTLATLPLSSADDALYPHPQPKTSVTGPLPESELQGAARMAASLRSQGEA